MKRTEVKFEEVKQVYSGRAGACCCGCAGNYRYPSTMTPEKFKASHGYDLDKSNINDVQVRRVVKLLNEALKRNDPTLDFGNTYLAVENEARTRVWIAYFTEE